MSVPTYEVCHIFNCLPKVLKDLKWQNQDVEKVSVGLSSINEDGITFEMRVDFKSDRLCLCQNFVMSNHMLSKQIYDEVASHMLHSFIQRIKKV